MNFASDLSIPSPQARRANTVTFSFVDGRARLKGYNGS